MSPQQHQGNECNFDESQADTVVVVDPYSTGCLVVREIIERGYGVIALWTKEFSEDMKTHIPKSCGRIHYIAEVEEGDSLEETAKICRIAAKGADIAAVIVGGEAGVETADALSEFMGLKTNGTQIPNRRDKAVQQELIKKAGLRSIREVCGTTIEEVDDFLKSEQYPIVLKPTESAGSDGVKLCYSYDDAVEHFQLLMSKQLINGGACPAVLCQEFLRGKEYIVDTVSCDGHHKVMMCVVYDKRPANGSAFVYFGEIPIEPTCEEAKQIIPYIKKVLDALQFKNGPCHGEVIITETGPCLVEMNCRCDGGNGTWHPLYKAMCGGYSQIEATVDAFFNPERFFELPDEPKTPFSCYGQEVHLVSYQEGTVVATPGLEAIRALPSFCIMEGVPEVGKKMMPSIDLDTCVGGIVLKHEDPEQVERDIAFIRQLENENKIFTVQS